jgi:hypothetical protein
MKRERSTLRQRCEARLRTLPLPEACDLDAIITMVEHLRGRPVEIYPAQDLGGPLGAWTALSTADVITYVEQTSRFHQEHTILHEVAHMLCEHGPDAHFPDISPDTVRMSLWRTIYDSEQEREAEILASLLMERTTSRTALGRLPASTDHALNARLEMSLAEQRKAAPPCGVNATGVPSESTPGPEEGRG